MLITGIHSVSDTQINIHCIVVICRIFPGNRVYIYVHTLRLYTGKLESVAPHVVQVHNMHTNLRESPRWDLLDFSTKLHLAHSSGRWCHSSA